MMWAITRLAHAEFWKAAGLKTGTASARDFLWLTLFFTLSSFLAFFCVSAYQGTWERFEQVLLGALPGTGSPIRLSYHFTERPADKISGQLVEAFRKQFPDLSIVPMRSFEGKTGTVVLPGLALSTDAAIPTEASPEKQRQHAKKIDEARSWQVSKDGGNTPLQILALPLDSPIWRWIAGHDGARGLDLQKPFPLVMAASRTLLDRHFSYQNYQKAVAEEQAAPCVLRSAIPEKFENLQELKSIVLEVKEGAQRTAFHAFDLIWVDSFPLSEQVAFVLPLPTVEVLMAAESAPKLDLHLEVSGPETRRIERILLTDINGDQALAAKFRKLATCLGAVPVGSARDRSPKDGSAKDGSAKDGSAKDDPVLACGAAWDDRADCDLSQNCAVPRFRGNDDDLSVAASRQWPLRQPDVEFCSAIAGLGDIFSPSHPLRNRFKDDRIETTPDLKWLGPSRVSMPCGAFVASAFVKDGEGQQAGKECKNALEQGLETSATATARLGGYPSAMVYVGTTDAPPSGARAADASKLQPDFKEVVRRLLNWNPDGVPVFTLDPAYESALVRFGVLADLADWMSRPLAWALAALYLMISYVILATAFAHRRTQYGILAMSGLHWWQIQYLAFIQIMLASAIGCLVGLIVFIGIVDWLNTQLADSKFVKDARDLIGLDIHTFVGGLSARDVGITWFVISLISSVLGFVLLSTYGVWRKRAPIDLIKS